MTELFLDGFRIDIKPEQIRQTFQNNKLGDVRDRQLNFTNTFKVFNTGKNERFFGHLLELNSQSDKPYKFIPAKIVEDGLEVNVGSATIRKSDDTHVELYIYSGVNSLYEAINNKSIRDLDWTDLNHTLTFTIAEDSFDSSQPYIYGISNQTTLINRKAYLEYWLPSVFEYVIFDKILQEAGFTYEGDFFATDEFKAPVINPVTFDEEESDFLVRDFSKFMPDILQTEFLRDIFTRYGLVFNRERNTDNYIFKQIKDVFRNRADADDWSGKFVSIEGKEYVLGDYAIRNYFRYADAEGYNKNADGFFEITTENLPQQKTIYNSVYTVNQKINVFNDLVFTIFEFDEAGTTFESISEVDPTISTIEYINGSMQLTSDGGNGPLFNGDIPYLRFKDLAFSGFILNHYYELQKIADKAKVIDALVYLDPIDIYNLDFFKLVYIKSLGGYFYKNKISDFRSGKETKCNLVRIPANVFSEQEGVNTAPVVDLEMTQTVNQGETVNFTAVVTDAENNIESWIMNFGDGISQTGFGAPPTTFEHIYNQAPRVRTAMLTVTDFEGLQGSDSVTITVNAVNLTTFNRATGLYTAPPGSTVTVTIQCVGAGDCSSILTVGTTPISGGTLASLGASLNITPAHSPTQGVFVMPGNGQAYFAGTHSIGPSGPAPNSTIITIDNNGEVQSSWFDNANPIPE